MDWTAIAVIGGFVINAIVVAFSYGSLSQRVKELERRACSNSSNVHEARKEMELRLANQSHVVLKECQETFMDLSQGIAEIKGKVDILINIIAKERTL